MKNRRPLFESNEGAPRVEAPDADGRGRVLVVDDTDDARTAAISVLAGLGYRVRGAVHAAEALAMLEQDPFNAILSDIAMPGMSGLEFLREVRARHPDVPVVLMTGDPTLETAIRAIDLGALSYLLKPLKRADLDGAMGRAVRLHNIARFQRRATTMDGTVGVQFGDRTTLDAHLDSAIAKMWPALQPIVTLSGRRVFAYEALMRSRDEVLCRPPEIIGAAEKLGRTEDLGRAMRNRIATAIDSLAAGILVFVNLHSDDLSDPCLYDAAAPLSRHAERVILEITERASLEGVSDLTARLDSLRKLGYRIAVDDLGAGYAGLSSLIHLDPEVVKLDMSLVRGVDQDGVRAKMIEYLMGLCKEIGMEVIAEGIETAAERDELVRLGCDLHQGYLYGKPAAEPAAVAFPPA